MSKSGSGVESNPGCPGLNCAFHHAWPGVSDPAANEGCRPIAEQAAYRLISRWFSGKFDHDSDPEVPFVRTAASARRFASRRTGYMAIPARALQNATLNFPRKPVLNQATPETAMPKPEKSMLKKVQDHRNWAACFFAVPLLAKRRTALRVQNSTNPKEAPEKTTRVKSRMFKYIIVRTRNTPNTNADGAAQTAWVCSLLSMEPVFLAVSGRPVQATTNKPTLTAISNVPTKMASVFSLLARTSLPAILSKKILSTPAYSSAKAASRVSHRTFFGSFISRFKLSTIR